MNILFLGNSHTFFNGLPFQVRELLRLRQPATEVTMNATGGMTLGWHAEQPATHMAIKYHDWDYIVLQQKTHPFDGYDALLRDCTALLPHLRQSRASILLYMTWSEKQFPANQAILDHAYRQTARAIGATLVPVSTAWHRALQTDPYGELYDIDGEHANACGSYLAACVFYAMIQRASPVGLPTRITVRNDVLANIPIERALGLQQAAWWATKGLVGEA